MAPIAADKGKYQESGTIEPELKVTGDAYDVIASIARGENKTPTDVLAEAISLKRWFSRVGKDGGEVFVQSNGRLRRVSQS